MGAWPKIFLHQFLPKNIARRCRKVHAALEEAAASVQPSTMACKSLPDAAEGFVIKALNESSLVLQVRPGTDRLELGSLGVDDSNQKWRKLGDRLQHVGTGLFLDANAKYPFYQRGNHGSLVELNCLLGRGTTLTINAGCLMVA